MTGARAGVLRIGLGLTRSGKSVILESSRGKEAAMLRVRIMDEIAGELGGYVNPHYSGRGMYGATCPAIIIPSEASSLMLLGGYIADLVGMDDGGDMIRR